MRKPSSFWIKLALINLSVVAFIGIILRYKIVFSLPFVDQKHLLHAHSHFAFYGWVSLALMTLLIQFLEQHGMDNAFTRYRSLLFLHTFAAVGMLISFPIQGYGLFSISFSTLGIFISYFFALRYWGDLKRIQSKSAAKNWFRAAVFFNALSSLGAFALAYMMARHVVNQNAYLSSVYFFLHFQYNGWFFFACMGLWLSFCEYIGIDMRQTHRLFLILVASCVPAYYLSALWMPMYTFVYALVVLAAAAQVYALVLFLQFLRKNKTILSAHLPKGALLILSLSCLALIVKFILQLGSTYPPLSQLAFGFRPIIIAYLHLVLLGVISFFLLGFMLATKQVVWNRYAALGLTIFVSGVVFNEIVLCIQGVAGLQYQSVPYTNECLLGIALILFTGAFFIAYGQFRSENISN